MEHPEFLAGLEGIGRIAGRRKEAVPALVDVAGGVGHGPADELAGARRPTLFEAVDEHLHADRCLDGRQHVARAPPRRQAAPRAAGSTGENNASAHEKSSGIKRSGFMTVSVDSLSDCPAADDQVSRPPVLEERERKPAEIVELTRRQGQAPPASRSPLA